MNLMKEGDKAPDFELEDQNGEMHRLKDYKGKWLVVYFYPKDSTPGCTKEACGFRDHHAEIDKMAAVVGVSADSVKRHANFAGKYELPFTLLADEEKQMIQSWGVWGPKKFMGREFLGINRITYLVDPKGKIAKVYPKVKTTTHAEEVLADLKELAG